MPERTAEEVQFEIEKARDALAGAVDQLAIRANPKRLAEQAKHSAWQQLQTPVGKAVVGSAGAFVVLLVLLRVRKGRSRT